MDVFIRISESDGEKVLKCLEKEGIKAELIGSAAYAHADEEIDMYLETSEDELRGRHMDLETELSFEEYLAALKGLLTEEMRHEEEMYDAFCDAGREICYSTSTSIEEIEVYHHEHKAS